jgi:hypothetical protein
MKEKRGFCELPKDIIFYLYSLFSEIKAKLSKIVQERRQREERTRGRRREIIPNNL